VFLRGLRCFWVIWDFFLRCLGVILGDFGCLWVFLRGF
jgi:hypothetical protein